MNDSKGGLGAREYHGSDGSHKWMSQIGHGPWVKAS